MSDESASGVFAVYGVTRTLCRMLAERRMRNYVYSNSKLSQAEKMREFGQVRDQLAEKIYRESPPLKLPAIFSDPEGAERYIELMKNHDQGRDLGIFYRHPVGKTKSGRTKTEWREWRGTIPAIEQTEG